MIIFRNYIMLKVSNLKLVEFKIPRSFQTGRDFKGRFSVPISC